MHKNEKMPTAASLHNESIHKTKYELCHDSALARMPRHNPKEGRNLDSTLKRIYNININKSINKTSLHYQFSTIQTIDKRTNETRQRTAQAHRMPQNPSEMPQNRF